MKTDLQEKGMASSFKEFLKNNVHRKVFFSEIRNLESETEIKL